MPADYRPIIEKANKTLEAESSISPFRTLEWYQAVDIKSNLKASKSNAEKAIKSFTAKPHSWSSNPFEAFFMGTLRADLKKISAMKKYNNAKIEEEKSLFQAMSAQSLAKTAGLTDQILNNDAEEAIDLWRKAKSISSTAKSKSRPKPYNQITLLICLMLLLAAFFSIGMKVMGTPFLKYIRAFCFIFFIAVLAYAASSNATMKHYGIGYAAWAILFGLIISNTIGTPKWIMPAVQTEYYIKTGLVLLGAEILFGKILSIGIPGIFVAWVITPIGSDTGYILIDNGVIGGLSKAFRGWFFCLAFVSIGLATNFRELKGHFKGGKPLILYFCGQTFNLILTLLMAYIMFYKVFPEITAKI